jgi:hypothetical protein
MLEKTVADAVVTTAKVVETGLKKAWSILDAASEKKAPSEYLSKDGISAIQGLSQAPEK